MVKKLEELYETKSLHEGLLNNLKRFGSEVKKRASVQAFPEAPAPKAAPAMPPKKIEKEPEGMSKAGMIGIATGVATGNPLAGLGAYYIAKQWKKAK